MGIVRKLTRPCSVILKQLEKHYQNPLGLHLSKYMDELVAAKILTPQKKQRGLLY
jgi:hypothetical protein